MTEAEKVNILLKKTINVLTMSSPYAFDLLIRMFVNQTEDIPTAAVFATEDARMHLIYNMEFMRDLKPGMRTYVLVHECLHVLLHHCTTRQSSNPAEHALDNLAMDLAVNSLIPCDDILISYPRIYDKETKTYGRIGVVLPSDFDFKDGLSFEQYKELLKQQFPEIEQLCNDCASGFGIPKDGSGGGNAAGDIKSRVAGAKNKDKNASDKVKTFGDAMDINKIDSHEGFTENGSVDSQIKDQFERSERNKRWGNLSIASVEQIKAAQSKQVPWNRLLRLHAGRFITESKVPTRRKWHKYHGKPFLGSEFKTVDPIACYLDVSGSMSTKDKAIFLGEMSRITPICPVYLWTFDAAVENPDQFRIFNGNDFMRAPVGLQGGGGTNFKCIIDHAKEKHIRMLIILTDGYAEEVTVHQAWGLDYRSFMHDVNKVFELPDYINKGKVCDFDMRMLYPPHSIFEQPQQQLSSEISQDGRHEFIYHPETRTTTVRLLPGGSMKGYLESLRRTINNIEAWNSRSTELDYSDNSAISIGCAKGSPEDRNWYKKEFIYIDEKFNDKYSLFFDICTRRFLLVKDDDSTIRDSFKYCDLKEEKYQKFINIVDNAIWPKFMNYLKECSHMLDNDCIFVNDKCTIVFSGFTSEMYKVLCKTRSIIEARALCMDPEDITCFSLDYHNHETAFPLDGTAFNIRKYVPDTEWQEFIKALEAKLSDKDAVILEGSRDVTSRLKHIDCDTRLKNVDIRTLL